MADPDYILRVSDLGNQTSEISTALTAHAETAVTTAVGPQVQAATDAASAAQTSATAAADAADAVTNLHLVENMGPSNGIDDTAWINAKLAEGKTLVGLPGETYRCGMLVFHSNSGLILDRTNTIQNLDPSNPLASNFSFRNPLGSSTGTITAGSAVMTTDLDAPVGSLVIIRRGGGGTGSGRSPLTAYVVAKGSGTLTVDRPALSGATGEVVTAYAVDHDIMIRGGVWDRGSATVVDSSDGNGLFFLGVDRLTVDIDKCLMVAGGHYMVAVAAVRRYTLGYGDAAWNRDGIHVTGPAIDGHITRARGTVGDDGVSITAADYNNSGLNYSAGDVIGFDVESVNVVTNQSCLKVLAGGPGFLVDGVRVKGRVSGVFSKHGVYIGEDTLNAATTGGSYGHLDVGLVDAVPSSVGTRFPIYLGSPHGAFVTGSVRTRYGFAAIGSGGTSVATMEYLGITLDVIGPNFYSGGATNLTIKRMVLDGTAARPTGNSGSYAIGPGNGEEIADLELRGTFDLTGSQGSLVYVAIAAAKVKRLHLSGRQIGGRALFRNIAGVEPTEIRLSGRVEAASRVLDLSSSATLILAGGVVDGVTTQPVYIQGGLVTVSGQGLILNPGNTSLVQKGAGGTVRVNGAGIPVDVSSLVPLDGDVALNNNAALACGAGVVVYNSAAAKWKNVYSGATT